MGPRPGPLLAFAGAALVRADDRARHLHVVVAVAAIAMSSTPLAIVAMLSGLSVRSFQAVQVAVLSGRRSEIVVAAVRWGWILAPVGLATIR